GPGSADAISGRNVGEQPRCVQMPTATHSSGLTERYSFLQSFGCCGASDLGSATRESSLGSDATISGVRRISQTTLPRHSTSIFWPISILLISTSIGAPAAFARSLGCIDTTNGTAVATTPTPPMMLVATTRKRRFSVWTSVSFTSSAIVASASLYWCFAGLFLHARKKPIDYTGLDRRDGS